MRQRTLSPLALAVLGALLAFAGGPRGAGARVAESVPVAPGVGYERHEGEEGIAHVVRADLKAPGIRVRSVKAAGKETVGDLVARVDDSAAPVLVAVNGDYFRPKTAAGLPFGVQVTDGRLLFAPMQRSMLAFGTSNEPTIEVVRFRGRLTLAPPESRAGTVWTVIDDVNLLESEMTGRDGVYLYTPAFLGLDLGGTRGLIAVVDEIQPNLRVGEVSEGRVARVETSDAKVAVPEAGCLLFFQGRDARAFAARLEPGRPVALKIDLPPADGEVTQAIGGGPRLVRDGKVSVEIRREEFGGVYAAEISKRHPRTAVGFDRGRRTLYLVMVEGRQESSRGMTFRELAEFLVGLGCWQAMAFDGGGSAGMYVADRGMVSYQGSGDERPEDREVANALLLVGGSAPAPAEPPR